MRRMLIVLSGILVLQVGAAVALTFSGREYGAFRASEPLLAFDKDSVKEVAIDESGGDSVVLQRQDKGWTLPGLYDFPADEKKVSALFERLAGLKKGLPVAVSGSSPKRFKLTEEEHERRILLRDGDKTLAELLVGTSPSYRQAHVRTPDDDEVYDVAFANYDAGTRPEDWMDHAVLAIPEGDITRIELPPLTLVRDDDDRLVLEGLGQGEEMDESAVNDLLGKLAKPTFTSVEGKGEEALARVVEPDVMVTLTRKDGATITYRLKKAEGKDDYLLASSAQDYLFRAPKYAVQPILEASREKLIKHNDEGGEAGHAKTGTAPSDDEISG